MSKIWDAQTYDAERRLARSFEFGVAIGRDL